MGYAWGTKRVTMEVTRAGTDAAPTVSSNPHTSATTLSLTRATAQNVCLSATFALTITRAQIAQWTTLSILLLLRASSTVRPSLFALFVRWSAPI